MQSEGRWGKLSGCEHREKFGLEITSVLPRMQCGTKGRTAEFCVGFSGFRGVSTTLSLRNIIQLNTFMVLTEKSQSVYTMVNN